jgi:hypothetical protein
VFGNCKKWNSLLFFLCAAAILIELYSERASARKKPRGVECDAERPLHAAGKLLAPSNQLHFLPDIEAGSTGLPEELERALIR